MDEQNTQPTQPEQQNSAGVSQNSVHPQSLLYLLAAFLTGVLLTGVVSYHLLAQSAVPVAPTPVSSVEEPAPQQPRSVFKEDEESDELIDADDSVSEFTQSQYESSYGAYFTLSLPNECIVGEAVKSIPQEEIVYPSEIECSTEAFSFIIYPRTGGRGTFTAPRISYPQVGSRVWEKRFFEDEEGLTFSTYRIDIEGYGGYLIGVVYDSFSRDAEEFFEEILATFEPVP